MLIVGMLDGKSCAFRQALGGLTDTDSEWHPLIKCCHGDSSTYNNTALGPNTQLANMLEGP